MVWSARGRSGERRAKRRDGGVETEARKGDIRFFTNCCCLEFTLGETGVEEDEGHSLKLDGRPTADAEKAEAGEKRADKERCSD